MSDIPGLDGIASNFVETPRLRQHVLSCGAETGEVVLLLHGNFSAATYAHAASAALRPTCAATAGARTI